MSYKADENIRLTGEVGIGTQRGYDIRTNQHGYVDSYGYFHPDPEQGKNNIIPPTHNNEVFQNQMNDIWNTFEQESRDVLIEGTHQYFVAIAAAFLTLFSLWHYKGKYSTKNIWRSYSVKDALLITVLQYLFMLIIVTLIFGFVYYGLEALFSLFR